MTNHLNRSFWSLSSRKKKHQDRWSDSLITIVFCLTDTCSYLNKRNDCSLCTCHSHEKKEEEGKHTDTYIQSTLYCENNIGQNIERKKKKDKLALHFHPSVIFIYNDRCRPYFAIHINNIQHSDWTLTVQFCQDGFNIFTYSHFVFTVQYNYHPGNEKFFNS